MLQVKPPELLRNKVALYIWVNYRYQINIVLKFIEMEQFRISYRILKLSSVLVNVTLTSFMQRFLC